MTSPSLSFTASLEQSTYAHEMEMWRAAQTVRAHVSPDAGLAAILDCLGVGDAQCPVRD